MKKQTKDIKLDENHNDILVRVINSVASQIPLVGGAISEIYGYLIPNQRMDRISNFIKLLDHRLSIIEQEKFKSRIQEIEFCDFVDYATVTALSSISKEKIESVTRIIQYGINKENQELVELKHILRILRELNSVEVIIMKYHGVIGINKKANFYKKHESIFKAHRLMATHTDEEAKKHSIYKSYLDHLSSLGLLKSTFTAKMSEYSEEAMVLPSGHSITEFGNFMIETLA